MSQILTLEQYIDGIQNKDVSVLSKAITLIESKNEKHRTIARQLLSTLPRQNTSIRIGISGTPGVGKSTFIESFGLYLIENGLKVGVLAIDPSSQVTGGSILGDKTRMRDLSSSKNAFIRPSPSGDSLGGVASKTRESILLCESFGLDVILVETVGVGQNEVAVSSMVDFFMVLMQPGGGDDLQGIKRGILELADLLVVNKADGDKKALALVAKQDYEQALHILRNHNDEYTPKVRLCSSLEKTGLSEIWRDISDFYAYMRKDAKLRIKRKKQLEAWLKTLLLDEIKDYMDKNEAFQKLFLKELDTVSAHQEDIHTAAEGLFKLLVKE